MLSISLNLGKVDRKMGENKMELDYRVYFKLWIKIVGWLIYFSKF